MTNAIWQYTDKLDADRSENLARRISPQELQRRIYAEAKLLCGHIAPCENQARYARVEYCVQVPQALFDTVFNSEYGLRGAYFRSEKDGEEFDRLLIESLSRKLIDWSKSEHSDFDQDLAHRSLMTRTSKMWLAEKERHRCNSCLGEWSQDLRTDANIANGRWEHSSHTHAVWGRQMHFFTKLKIFGAFVNDTGDPYVADHKRARSKHIFDWGWT